MLVRNVGNYCNILFSAKRESLFFRNVGDYCNILFSAEIETVCRYETSVSTAIYFPALKWRQCVRTKRLWLLQYTFQRWNGSSMFVRNVGDYCSIASHVRYRGNLRTDACGTFHTTSVGCGSRRERGHSEWAVSGHSGHMLLADFISLRYAIL